MLWSPLSQSIRTGADDSACIRYSSATSSPLPIIQIIGTVIDPPATTVNSVGDQASSMMVARVLDGKGWMDRPDDSEILLAEVAPPENS